MHVVRASGDGSGSGSAVGGGTLADCGDAEVKALQHLHDPDMAKAERMYAGKSAGGSRRPAHRFVSAAAAALVPGGEERPR